MHVKNSLTAALVASHGFFGYVTAHTWVEQLSVIASNGSFVGLTGYPRGNVLRTSASFSDGAMTYLLPPNGRSPHQILSTDNICMSSQTLGNQTPGSPALQASPGDMIALRYQENGHVTLPATQVGKPENRGTVSIYGTSKPSNSDKLLDIHNVWNAAGTGGNGNGVLLATRNFDDGQCYQVNGGEISVSRQKEFVHVATNPMGVNLWCQSDVTLPTNLPTSGSYTLYWVWDWPTNATVAPPTGMPEVYTTCMDITLKQGTGTSKNLNFAKGQDLNTAAVEEQLKTPFQVAEGSPAASSSAVISPPKASSTTTRKPSKPTSKSPSNVQPVTIVMTVTEKVAPSMITVTVTANPNSKPINTKSSVANVQTSASSPSPVSSGRLSIQPFQTIAVTTSSTQARSTTPLTTLQKSTKTVQTVDVATATTTVLGAYTQMAKPRGLDSFRSHRRSRRRYP